ncbi:putative WD repeat-containing protein 55 [Cocos nucifera]|uniref:Putative WD repeat-containing protein 55 n=1 Tax=Cocos nucifera TaxID=13894 RepID=A0A8K0NAF3_COCNU|nr:putative WD repeat-containing protein 55 [Cocos nucifera]
MGRGSIFLPFGSDLDGQMDEDMGRGNWESKRGHGGIKSEEKEEENAGDERRMRRKRDGFKPSLALGLTRLGLGRAQILNFKGFLGLSPARSLKNILDQTRIGTWPGPAQSDPFLVLGSRAVNRPGPSPRSMGIYLMDPDLDFGALFRALPMEINLGKLPFDLDFHPSSPLVASGLINGDLHVLLEINAHDESCRAVRFVDSGRASPDCSILATDVETGTAIARLEDAHGDAVNRLVNLTETTIASGDDEGGDGTLSVCSLRKNKVQSQSEFSEDELLSLVIMKNGRKVICGTQTGALLLYSWGHFKDCSDRFLGHPMSVDTLLKLDEDTLISGSEDGVIRLVGILPNRIIQPLAEHSEYPIERLAFSNDRKFLGSISHDQMLKLWDLQELLDGHPGTPAPDGQSVEADGDGDEMDVDIKPFKPAKDGSLSLKNSKLFPRRKTRIFCVAPKPSRGLGNSHQDTDKVENLFQKEGTRLLSLLEGLRNRANAEITTENHNYYVTDGKVDLRNVPKKVDEVAKVLIPGLPDDREENCGSPISSCFWEWKPQLPVHYEKSGLENVQAPNVLFLPGFGVGSFHYEKQLRDLSRDYKVWALDFLGQGLSLPSEDPAPSDKPGESSEERNPMWGFGEVSEPWAQDLVYSVDLWRDQVKQFIEQVIGEPVYVVGNSLGGFVALYLAACNPELVKGVTLLNATPFWGFLPNLTRSPRLSKLFPWTGTFPLPSSVRKLTKFIYLGPNWVILGICDLDIVLLMNDVMIPDSMEGLILGSISNH